MGFLSLSFNYFWILSFLFMDGKLKEIYSYFLKSAGAVTDSRKAASGVIYFAIRGERFNGNHFAGSALKNGALLAVVDEPGLKGRRNMIFVPDVLGTLQKLASIHRENNPLPMIAITGSNGKTTTKELMQRVLSKRYRVHATPGNLNNHIGLPLTILNMSDQAEMLVVEMGANHKGEIRDLCKIADPDYGIITNIGKAHLEGFGGYEGVIAAKSELYDHIAGKKGKVFVNIGNPLLRKLSEGIDRITYNTNGTAEVSSVLINETPVLEAEVTWKEGKFNLKTGLYGKYNHENVAAAVCAGLYFNVVPDSIREAVSSYRPDNMRSQIIETGKNRIYLDAYNANPTSMQNALEFFAGTQGSKKMLILGDMLELGKDSRKEHKAILNFIKNHDFDVTILIGPEFSRAAAAERCLLFTDPESASVWLDVEKPAGYDVLIKGSRGIGLEKLIGKL